jgi:hypothetical protein
MTITLGLPTFSGSAHESILGLAHFFGALMGGLETRIGRLKPVCGKYVCARRKALTDRAVLHGDVEALNEPSLHRPDKITASKEQRAAAVAAGLRTDL